eukprot:scaffold2726_cov167-Amphora_coffeaeformis.AAC.5
MLSNSSRLFLRQASASLARQQRQSLLTTFQRAMATASFSRDKPHVNIGTIGHVDHGKTTLTQAITKVLSEKGYSKAMTYEDIDKAPEEKARTNEKIDRDEKWCGVAVLVACATCLKKKDGETPWSRRLRQEHDYGCRTNGWRNFGCGSYGWVGIKNLVVFLNKCDMVDDEELLELVEMEVRELLDFYDFPGDDIPIIRGSALAAAEGRDPELGADRVMELMNAVDETFPIPERDIDKPFLMPIEDTFSISGRGTVVTGRVEQGKVNVGDDLDVVGLNADAKTTCTGVEMFKKLLDYGMAGDNVGCLLRGLKREDVKRGQVLCAPGSVTTAKKFEAEIYALKKDEGGRHTPFMNNYRPQFFLRTADVTGSLKLKAGVEMVMPGDNTTIEVELITPIALEPGLRFNMREGGMTVGTGIISKVLS